MDYAFPYSFYFSFPFLYSLDNFGGGYLPYVFARGVRAFVLFNVDGWFEKEHSVFVRYSGRKEDGIR